MPQRTRQPVPAYRNRRPHRPNLKPAATTTELARLDAAGIDRILREPLPARLLADLVNRCPVPAPPSSHT